MKFHLMSGFGLRLGPIAEALESLPGLEPGEQRSGIRTVDINLGKLREGNVVFPRAEFVDFGIAAGSLGSELVAGEVQDNQAFVGCRGSPG